MPNCYISHITLISLLLAILSACSNDDSLQKEPNIDDVGQKVEGIEDMAGAFIERDAFTAGDAISRSVLIFGENGLNFSWTTDDNIGMYTTAKKPDGNFDGLIVPDDENKQTWHPNKADGFYLTDPKKQQQAKYQCVDVRNGGLYAQIDETGSKSFDWEVGDGNKTRWTVYSPYNINNNPKANPSIYYNSIPFDFSNQTQQGFVNMSAYYGADGGYNNEIYKASEAAACAHLGQNDVLISAETEFAQPTIFHMRHIGAIARFFLLAPQEELTLVSLRLICNSEIFYTKGRFDLTSRSYVADDTKGMCLVGDNGENKQMAPDTSTKTNTLELTFGDDIKTSYSTSNPYGNYLVAYLMMYPITYNNSTDGNLYVYITAKDRNNNEVHFVSDALANKTMKSGYYYQWTSRTQLQEGLYPIELTATLLPWQDIVGGDIEIDIE